jgi:hypothetical protein
MDTLLTIIGAGLGGLTLRLRVLIENPRDSGRGQETLSQRLVFRQ